MVAVMEIIITHIIIVKPTQIIFSKSAVDITDNNFV